MSKQELQKILSQHKLWLESNYKEGERANLEGTNLERANLERANLTGANLKGANLPDFQLCSQDEDFISYKKTSKGVIRIKVHKEALKTSSLIGRKCRANFIEVLDGKGLGGGSPIYSDSGLIYDKGDFVVADSYDDDIRVECTNGIHFFMTEQEAKEC